MDKFHKVLLVDDDPDQLLLLGALLEREHYLVTQARDGLEGLSTMASQEFDIVVTDISMPNMDGLDFARELKRRSDRTPVVLLTAGVEPIDFSSKSFRADAFCLKQNLRGSLLPKMKALQEPAEAAV